MIRKLTLAASFGAGYVLGAKAGKERYAEIEAKFRELAGLPAVQDVTSNLADTAAQIGDKAKAAVNEKVSTVGNKVAGKPAPDVVDLGKTGTSKTGARTASGPMAGAAASATAPDKPSR